jgi:hypothetical protein
MYVCMYVMYIVYGSMYVCNVCTSMYVGVSLNTRNPLLPFLLGKTRNT